MPVVRLHAEHAIWTDGIVRVGPCEWDADTSALPEWDALHGALARGIAEVVAGALARGIAEVVEAKAKAKAEAKAEPAQEGVTKPRRRRRRKTEAPAPDVSAVDEAEADTIDIPDTSEE